MKSVKNPADANCMICGHLELKYFLNFFLPAKSFRVESGPNKIEKLTGIPSINLHNGNRLNHFVANLNSNAVVSFDRQPENGVKILINSYLSQNCEK